MNKVRRFRAKLSQPQNTNNLPNLKNIKTTSNKFPPKIFTTISHTNNIENSKLNKQQNNFNLTKIVSNQYPILITIILEYKTLSARPSSDANCQNWQKTEGRDESLDR